MNDKNDEKEPQRKDHAIPKHRLFPLFVLLVLAPVVAELLLGDITLNSGFLFLLLLNLTYYGTGAIVIREIVRRRGLNWVWIPILACVYGLIQEGLVLHSLFNPKFPGVGSLGYYGRAFGIDWIWALFVLGLHATWSISLPILVTEIIFTRYRKDRWVGNLGLSICCVVFVLGMSFLAYIYAKSVTPDFKSSPLLLAVDTLLAVGILLLALFVPARRPVETMSRATLSPWFVGGFAFIMGVLFLGARSIFLGAWNLPAELAFVIYIILAAVAVVVIRYWSTPDRNWNDFHRVALAFGALVDYCIFGFFVTPPDVTDQIFHGCASVITLVLMVFLALKVRARARHVLTEQPMPATSEMALDHSLPLGGGETDIESY